MFSDYLELSILSIMALAYIFPAAYIIRKYKGQMDAFSYWMIVIYIIGFICKFALYHESYRSK
jgi:hypothetical protein